MLIKLWLNCSDNYPIQDVEEVDSQIPTRTTADICLCPDSRQHQSDSWIIQSQSDSTLNSDYIDTAGMFQDTPTCNSLHNLEYRPQLGHNYHSLHALEQKNKQFRTCLRQIQTCQGDQGHIQQNAQVNHHGQLQMSHGQVQPSQENIQFSHGEDQASQGQDQAQICPSQAQDINGWEAPCQQIQTCKSMFVLESKHPRKNKSFSLQMFRFGSFSSSNESVSAPLLDNTGNL